jgi:hypothetical protein
MTTSNYLVNDDFVMAEFMNGNFTGKLESNTVFMHPIIGSIISQLNSMNLNIPWFPLFIVLVQVFSLSTLAIMDLSRLSYMFLAFFSMAHIAFVTVVPSFTPAAIVTSSCGIALFLHAIGKNSQRIVWIGFLFIILGSLIRFNGMAFAVAMFVMPTFLLMTNSNNRKNVQLRLLAPALVLIAGIFFVSQTPSICKTQSECAAWAEFNSFNTIRGSFHGSDRMALLKEGLENTNWNLTDYRLFSTFAYTDDVSFNLENLEQINEVVPSSSIAQALFSNPLGHLSKVVTSNIEISLVFFPVFAGFLYVSLSHMRGFRSQKYFLLFNLMAWLIATGAVATIRFPIRIHEPALVSLSIILLIWNSSTAKSVNIRITRSDLKRFSSLLLVSTLILLSCLINYSTRNENRLSVQNARFDYLEENFPNSRFIVQAALLTDLDPWANSNSELPERLLYLGWMTPSPHFKAKKENLKMGNIYRELVESESLFLISSKRNATFIAEYLNEKFDADIKPFVLRELPEGEFDISIWTFRSLN